MNKTNLKPNYARSGWLFLACILTIVWSFFVTWILRPILGVASLLSDRIKEQLDARPRDEGLPIRLAQLRRKYDDCIVFFCSSAGEYEQAKPLIDRIAAKHSVLCHVFFFSVSGAKFIRARRDEISWSMSPLDDVWKWGDIFAALRPSKTIIIRHELWPAFLWQASRWSQVIVVNAVVPSLYGRQSKWKDGLNLAIKGWLLRYVDRLCVVAVTDQEFFANQLKIPSNKVLVTGDTKYDRVVERASNKRATVKDLRLSFRQRWSPEGCDILLIGGSVHLPDVELLLEAFQAGSQDVSLKRLKILLVPHIVNSGNIARIFDRVKQLNFQCELLSEVENAKFNFSGEVPRVIIADEIGRLSDLYGVADIAWVGGAVTAKVHNILEPAAWGIPVACGLHFKNSQEATALDRADLLFSTASSQNLRSHLIANMDVFAERGAETLAFVLSMAGASDRILKVISTSVFEGETI